MEFLDKLVLPHSGPNLELLKYLLILAQLIFLIFSGTLLGSSILSLFTRFYARRKNNPVYYQMSSDYMDLILPNKVMGIGLGIIPFISVILIYIQLLHGSSSDIISFLLLSLALYIVGFALLVYYDRVIRKKRKTAIQVNNLNSVSSGYSVGSFNLSVSIIGIILFFVSLRLFLAVVTFTFDPVNWSKEISIISILLPASSILGFLNFLTISFAISSAAFIVKIFHWDKKEDTDSEYEKISSRFSISVALIFTLLQPAFIIFNIILIPENTISSVPFGLMLIAIILAFILVHLLYSNLKTKSTNYSTLSFYIVLSIFGLIVVNNQVSFDYASRAQVLKLSNQYDIDEAALLEKQGKIVSNIDGGEIYKTKCMACHKFDVKFVGPAHHDVLVKYKGREEDMIKFVLNPVKVDPAFPPMPAQGLTPKEARAVVEYMFKHYADQIK